MEVLFHGASLRLARVFHSYSLEDLGQMVGKSRQYLSRLETGSDMPSAELLEQLAQGLGVTPAFFASIQMSEVPEYQIHFRKLSSTREGIRQTTQAHGRMFEKVAAYLDGVLKLPAVDFPSIDVQTPDDIERAAEACRQHWGIGLGPLLNTIRLAERAGALVTTFDGVSSQVDALSIKARRPVIVRNEAKESACRQRFDVAHEIGHFVMHEGRVTGDRMTESQANRFASALLVPRVMMLKHFPPLRGGRLDWQGISQFKRTWGISKAALLYRAHQLGLLDDDQYKRGVIHLSRSGQAKAESEDKDMPLEQPELLANALRALKNRLGVDLNMMAKDLDLSPRLLLKVLNLPPAFSGNVIPFPKMSIRSDMSGQATAG
ncbi:ImmA/IrrE family metallo-endopeptidase [Chromobacterium vaccinii]|nr:ImmA/IrrE family metallo-endopeptidase [Chromobacterium vaccinii]